MYIEATGRRLTFEYVLIDGVNDGLPDARALERLLAGLACHVNLIPLNPVPGIPLRRPPISRVQAFAGLLKNAAIPVTIRIERGGDIQAACGQLRLAPGLGRPSRWTPPAPQAVGLR
jgi:23S rRNA (adenine2503-C2)-methyltransferase